MQHKLRCWLAGILSLALCAGGGLLCCQAAKGSGSSEALSLPLLSGLPFLIGFAAGAALLLLFAVQISRDQTDPGFLWSGLAVFLFLGGWLASQIPSAVADFRSLETILCFACSLSALFLALSCWGGRGRFILCVPAVLYLAVSFFALARKEFTLGGFTISTRNLPIFIGLVGLVLALILGWLWRKGRSFFRCFVLLTLIGAVGVVLWQLLGLEEGWSLPKEFRFRIPDPVILSDRILLLALITMTVSALMAYLLEESAREEESLLLQDQADVLQEGYESLMHRSEVLRMMRHDMEKHFYALRQLAEGGDPQLIRYLDELIQADNAVRPLVQSGSPLLGALLNGSLSRAMDEGVSVEVRRDEAPGVLSVSDADLTSLVLNVMDNALEAATAPGLEEPYIHLDLYTKGSFFFLSCENAKLDEDQPEETNPDNPRGLGLKIVRQITERNGGLVQIEQEPDIYRIQIALPL